MSDKSNEVAENTFYNIPLMLLGLMHILTNLVNRICNHWSCNRNILKSSYNEFVESV